MTKELKEYLRIFLIQNNWDYPNVPDQARSIFTTICLLDDIHADTLQCDTLIKELFDIADMKEVIEYDDFESYMIGLII